ncbi:MAG: ABC transporter permease [Clostridia bacterium]|nr:ABC transporter permease [Clostridia bacterium]
MSGFLALFKNDLRIIVKDYKALLLLFSMPLLVIQLFAAALSPLLESSAFIEPFKIAVVDQDKSKWTGLLSTQLKSLGIVEEVVLTDEAGARSGIQNQEVAAAIVLPKDLTSSIDRWEPQIGRVLGSNLFYLQSRLVKNIAFVGASAVSSGLAALNVIYDLESANGYTEDELYNEANAANTAYIDVILARKMLVAEDKLEEPDVSPVVYYALSLLAVFIMFSSIPCMKLLTEERRLGIRSRLNASPSKSWQTILSKLILSFMISTVQFLLIVIFILAASGNNLSASIGQMIPVFITTTLASGAFSLLVASLADTGSAADLIANLSILLMAVIGGSIYPITSLPEFCRGLSVVTINRWSSTGFINALYGQNPSGTARSVLALVLLAVVFSIGAMVILRLKRRRNAA